MIPAIRPPSSVKSSMPCAEKPPCSSTQVAGDRGLAVGGHREHAPAARRMQRRHAQEGADRVDARVPLRQRRHRERDVVGQQRGDRADVAALPGGDELADQHAQALVPERAQRRLLALAGEALVDGLVRALERAVDRGGRRLQRLGDLGAREAEHLAEDQHRALARGQVLERGDERELDALALLVGEAGVAGRARPTAARRHRLAEPVVRVGGRAVVDREHELGPPLDEPQAGVGRDRVEPRAQRAAALEPRQPAPRAEQRLLQRVLGVLDRAEHPVAVGVQLGAVRRDEPLEGGLVAAARGVEQGHLGCHSAISPPSGTATTLRRPAGPSRGSSRTDAPSSPARSVTASTSADLDVGDPDRRAVPHSTMPPPKPRREVEREVGADAPRAPAEQLRVERARARRVAGVELEVDERARPHGR